MITPSFFATLPSSSIHYLGIHVLPPHGPPFTGVRGSRGICCHIFVFEDKDDIKELASVMEGIGAIGWPKGGMEESEEDASGWYEVLARCASRSWDR